MKDSSGLIVEINLIFVEWVVEAYAYSLPPGSTFVSGCDKFSSRKLEQAIRRQGVNRENRSRSRET